jgi:DNA-binding CsgD family transcriptional regulator
MIGRDEELAVVEAFLDRPTDGLRALVLEGEAGIGKSTLWLAAVAAARGRSFHVLTSRPAEAERSLSYVVLGDLFGEVEADALATLPAPRRYAFEAALLRTEPDLPVDPRALGVAMATLLPQLGNDRPLVIAIDDEQWADPSSAAALDFALRRALERPILLLLSRRVGGRSISGLEVAIAPANAERLRIGPLSVGAIQLLVRHRLGIAFPRPMLLRFHELSGGNPFHALELARAQSLDRSRDTTVPLAVPTNLSHLVGERLRALDGPTRHALLLIAAYGRMPVWLIRGLGVASDALDAAFARNIIETTEDVLAFTHPLLASAVYEEAAGDERRAAHRLLAKALVDPVQRAAHLALGAEGPDDELAAALESASTVAHQRGIPIAVAELAAHALRLTPRDSVDDRHRRVIASARAHFEAGDGARAREIAADLRARAAAGQQRAEALVLSAELEQKGTALDFLGQALAEAADVPALRAVIHAGLAEAGRGRNELAWAERHAQASLRLAEHLEDDALRARALATLAPLRFDRGDPQALQLAERAYTLAAQLGDQREMKWAGWSVGHMLTWSVLTARAREWLETQLTLWGDRDEEHRWSILEYLAMVELWSGHWDLASHYAEQAQQISVQYGPEEHFALMFITLYRGQLALATKHARNMLSRLRGELIPAYPAAIGICEMWNGHPAAALSYFLEAENVSDARGLDEANNRWWRSEYVEALLQAGRIDDAQLLLDDWEAAPTSISRDRVLAQLTRCRGLIVAARGDLAASAQLLEEAASLHDAANDRFGQARSFLSLGIVRRRARQKRTAHVALAAALAGFETLGAMSWVEATRAERGRIGGRERMQGLSPSEFKVAELVAGGLTNREVAAALFLGETTVASHLKAIYAKLGVRSRTELALQLVPAQSPASASEVPPS